MISDFTSGKLKYILYKPSDESNLPLVVVLHGSGEIGSSLSKLKKREPYISLNNGRCKPNACVMMPQLPKKNWIYWKSTLYKLIFQVARDNKCNTDRIMITGHSLGANGTMDFLLAFPHFFSAAAVLSPCKDYGDKLKELVDIPIWFLHGEKEHNYKKYAQQMEARLEKFGGKTKITSVTGYGHPIQFCWTSSKYNVLEWLVDPVIEPTNLGYRDLKKGCKGSDVQELQVDLIKIGYSLPKHGADGDYGNETIKAVKAFQADYDLPDDGVMNVGNDFDVLFKALNESKE